MTTASDTKAAANGERTRTRITHVAGGAELSIVDISANGSVTRVPPTFLEICYVLGGSVTAEATHPNRTSIREGQFLYRTGTPLPPVTATGEDARCFFLHLDRDWNGWKLSGTVEPSAQSYRAGDAEECGALERIVHALHNDHTSQHLMTIGLVFQALAEIVDPPATEALRTQPSWITGVFQKLRNGSPEETTLDSLAKSAGVSRAQLVRSFRTHTGSSVGEYLREMKVNRARAMLTRTDRSIAEVAFECGFGDQSHFTRVFRETTGDSPRRYRQSRQMNGDKTEHRIDPSGRYSFSSYTAAGLRYEGTFEIHGEPGSYSGHATTPVLPMVHFSEILVIGDRITIVADVPAGLAFISLQKHGSGFRGAWQLGANKQPVVAARME